MGVNNKKGDTRKALYIALSLAVLSGIAIAQDTPYGSCPDRAETYQKRYESSGQSRDLVCYKKALEREMSDTQRFSCPRSAQYYQTAYESTGNSSDLVCYQQALKRELR
jgi:hypothetical protein